MIRKNKGITLVSLVITIIVMLILAGVSLNMIMGDSSVLDQATKAVTTQELSKIKESFEMQALGDTIKSKVNREPNKNATAHVMGEKLRDFIPNISDDFLDQVAIFNGKLVYINENATEEEKQIALELGYLHMNENDYLYMYSMYVFSDIIFSHKDDATLKGTKLGHNGQTETVFGGIVFGLPWYRLTEANLSEFPEFNDLPERQQATLKARAPLVVNYETGEVISVAGYEMYAGTEDKLHVYSFNYSGSNNEKNISMEGLLSGINGTSVRQNDKYGELVPTKTYAESGTTAGVIENNYKNDYTYDEYGGAKLDLYTNILSMPIDETKEINKKFSLNITFKADLMDPQQGKPGYGGSSLGACLLAISDLNGKDVCSVRLRYGQMTVITFSYNGGRESDYELGEKDGYAVIDIKKFDNKFINLNIVAERGGLTKVYINGQLVSTFNSGNEIYTYKSCTIGDLRAGRGMKFIGSIYNFGLYGTLLSESQIAQNWEYTKLQLNTNEAGTVLPK